MSEINNGGKNNGHKQISEKSGFSMAKNTTFFGVRITVIESKNN